MSKTGYCLGRLSPIVYYQNADGHIILPPTEETARGFHEYRGRDGNQRSYYDRGYMLKEAGTLPEVYDLQNRIVQQELKAAQATAEREAEVSEAAWQETGSRLYQRMISAKTSEAEKEIIRIWLSQRDERRRKHLKKWEEYNAYLWAAEMDSGTKGIDRMKSEDGDRWQRGV